MIKYYLFILLFFSFNSLSAMDKKPYHHIYKDGKLFAFRNLEGGPKRDPNFKWDWKVFREEKKKLKIDYPPEHVIDKQLVLKGLTKLADYGFFKMFDPSVDPTGLPIITYTQDPGSSIQDP